MPLFNWQESIVISLFLLIRWLTFAQMPVRRWHHGSYWNIVIISHSSNASWNVGTVAHRARKTVPSCVVLNFARPSGRRTMGASSKWDLDRLLRPSSSFDSCKYVTNEIFDEWFVQCQQRPSPSVTVFEGFRNYVIYTSEIISLVCIRRRFATLYAENLSGPFACFQCKQR